MQASCLIKTSTGVCFITAVFEKKIKKIKSKTNGHSTAGISKIDLGNNCQNDKRK